MKRKTKPKVTTAAPDKPSERSPRVDAITRDHFAAMALNGLCATRAQHKIDMIAEMAPELAATSYVIADHMIKMRGYSTKELRDFLAARKENNK